MNKTLLLLAAICLVAGLVINIGLVNTRGYDALYIIFPVGAVFAGLFLIARMLEKESARFDEDQARMVRLENKRPEEQNPRG
ncbi:MAG TPA: hypothetical protein VG146_06165 [Verrucomicrobiae bacterium]|nr:hypothetical protein [Verrucomicrobiae bacterium]